MTSAAEIQRPRVNPYLHLLDARSYHTFSAARFRIKKKQKTVNLQRSISDLTGRAEDLEREVADLRRENGWLKEIVMLKNSRFPAANLMDQIPYSNFSQRSDAGPSRTQSGSRQADLVSSDDASSDEEKAKAGKGRKGKTKRKGNKSKTAKH
jgi:Basic region leucine zipper